MTDTHSAADDRVELSGPPVVFCGPTIGAERVRQLLPDSVPLPPASAGDIVQAVRIAPRAIVLIDGVFDVVPSPWHKEILWAIELGIPVVGASSMGALRAAELDRFGMTGVGAVYESYARGARSSDADVAVLQLPADHDYAAVTDAMVDIEAVTQRWQDCGALSPDQADQVRRLARAAHYGERRLPLLISEALGDVPETLAAELAQRARWSAKRADAELALDLVARDAVPAPALREPVARTIFVQALVGERGVAPFPVADGRLPDPEHALAEAPSAAGAAGMLGGLLRAIDMLGPQRGRTWQAPGWLVEALGAAGEIAARWTHPAGAATVARLERLAASMTIDDAAPDDHEMANLLVEMMSGLGAAAWLGAPLVGAVDALVDERIEAPPDAIGAAQRAWGQPPAGRVAGARAAARVEHAARLFAVLTGRQVTAFDGQLHPLDAPILDGAALVRAGSR